MQNAGSKQKLPDPIQLYLDPGMQLLVKNSITTALQLISANLQTATVVHMMGHVTHQPKLALDSKFIDVKNSLHQFKRQCQIPQQCAIQRSGLDLVRHVFYRDPIGWRDGA